MHTHTVHLLSGSLTHSKLIRPSHGINSNHMARRPAEVWTEHEIWKGGLSDLNMAWLLVPNGTKVQNLLIYCDFPKLLSFSSHLSVYYSGTSSCWFQLSKYIYIFYFLFFIEITIICYLFIYTYNMFFIL